MSRFVYRVHALQRMFERQPPRPKGRSLQVPAPKQTPRLVG